MSWASFLIHDQHIILMAVWSETSQETKGSKYEPLCSEDLVPTDLK